MLQKQWYYSAGGLILVYLRNMRECVHVCGSIIYKHASKSTRKHERCRLPSSLKRMLMPTAHLASVRIYIHMNAHVCKHARQVGGHVDVGDCTIKGNKASGVSAGVEHAHVSMRSCSVAENQGNGATAVDSGVVTMEDCQVSGNSKAGVLTSAAQVFLRTTVSHARSEARRHVCLDTRLFCSAERNADRTHHVHAERSKHVRTWKKPQTPPEVVGL